MIILKFSVYAFHIEFSKHAYGICDGLYLELRTQEREIMGSIPTTLISPTVLRSIQESVVSSRHD